MADDWENEDFEPPPVPVPRRVGDKWEGEDEDEPVKDSWEDEEAEEKPAEPKIPDTKISKKKKLEQKIAEKEPDSDQRMYFLRVELPDSEQTIELPLEDDGTLLLTTLKSKFANANGLTYDCRFRTEKFANVQIVKLSVTLREGKFLPPPLGWFEFRPPPNTRTYKIRCTKEGNMRRKCVALFSYAPQHEDELALAVGDSVDFIEEVEEGWWRGSHQGKIGVFPSNFVSVPTEVSEAKSSPSSNLGATKALPSTATPTPGNLPISEARNAANVSQIEVLTPVEDTSAPSLPPKPVREMARALFPYASQHPDELELNEGDMVVILSKECEDKGWWKGQLNGKIGVFPDNFVELIVVPAAASSPIKPARPERPPEKPIGLIQPTATLSSTSPAVPMALSSVSASKPISVPDKTEALTRKESTSSLPSQTLYKSVSAGSFPKLSISPTPTSLPKAPLSAGISNAKVQDVDLDSLITDKSTNLQHLTTSRPAGPKRRPPSSYIKDQDVTIATENTPPKVNGYSAANEEPNNNIEENDGLIRPQKEKNVTPPWLKELSEKQENRISKMAVKDESVIDNTVGKLAGINKPTVPVQKPEDKPYIPLKPSSVSANKVTHPSPPVTKTQKSVSGKLPAAPMIGGPLVAATSQNVALSSNPEELQKEVLSLRGEVDTLKSEVRSLQHSLGGMQQSLSGVLSEMSVLRRILQDQGFGSSII